MFLLKGRYTAAGLQGSLAEGFGERVAYFQGLVAGHGGELVGVYWPDGEAELDVIAILDVPDPVAMKAIEMAMNQSGAIRVSIQRLHTAEEMDAARRKLPAYRPPGEASSMPGALG